MILRLLAAAAMIVQPFYHIQDDARINPTVSVSAVRSIDCGDWIGSGFLIGEHVMATALHVVADTKEQCVDADTGARLYVYKTDPKNDLALVTSPDLPTNIPYIKISCKPFKAGQPYLSWGRTSYGMDQWNNVLNRMNVIVALKGYSDQILDDGTIMHHVRKFDGPIAPGMSGGPVTDLHGYAYAVNNAGDQEQTVLHEFADGMLCNH
jgi:S1-C subfamily serine protease